MNIRITLYLLFVTWISRSEVLAQCSIPNFSIDTAQCTNDSLSFGSFDSSLSNYTWHINFDDINEAENEQNLGNFGGSLGNTDLALVEENGEWFGFNRNGPGNLYRLDFGSSLGNTPTISTVALNSFSLNSGIADGQLSIINHSGTYVGFGVSRSGNSLVRYEFLDSINTDTVSATNFGNPFGALTLPSDVVVTKIGSEYYAIVASFSNDRVVIYGLGSDPVNNSPQWVNSVAEQLGVTTNGPRGIEATYECGRLIVFVSSSFSDNIVRYVFSDPQNAPLSADDLFTTVTFTEPYGLQLVRASGEYHLYAKSQDNTNNFYRINFGHDLLSNVATTRATAFTNLAPAMRGKSFSYAYDDTAQYIFASRSSNRNLFRLKYEHIAGVDQHIVTGIAGIQSLEIDTGAFSIALISQDTGSTNTVWRDSFEMNLSPALSISSIMNDCDEDSTAFIALDTNNVASGWNWDFGDGNTSTEQNPIHVFDTAGNYSIEITSHSSSCSTTVDTALTIHPKPTAQFSIDTACQGNTLNIQNTSSVSQGSITSYLWDFGNGDSSVLQNPIYEYNGFGLFSVNLEVTTLAGCKDELNDSVFIKEGPIADFSISNTCLGDLTSFPNNTTSSFPFTSNWSFGDGNSSAAVQPLHTYLDTGNYTVKLVTSSSNGCGDSNSYAIRISAIPTLGVLLDNNPKCQNKPIALIDNSITEDSIVASKWIINLDTLIGITASHSSDIAGNILIEHEIIVGTQCLADTSFNLVLNEAPTAIFSLKDSCANQVFTAADSSIAGANQVITDFAWEFGDGNASSLQSPTHLYPDSGEYSIQLSIVTDSGCIDSVMQSVSFKNPPKISMEISGSMCTQNLLEVTLDEIVDVGDSIFTRVWQITDFNDTSSYTHIDSIVLLNNDTSQSVQLAATTKHGCIAILDTIIQVSQSPEAKPLFNQSCIGGIVNFSDVISGDNYVKTWNFGDGTVTNLNDPIHVYDSVGNYNVVLMIYDEFSGCSDSSSALLRVHEPISVSLPMDSFCMAQSTQVHPEVVMDSLDSIVSYSWRLNNEIWSVDSFAVLDGTQDDVVLEVAVTTAAGCSSTAQKSLSPFSPILVSHTISHTTIAPNKPLKITSETEESTNVFWVLNQLDTIGDLNTELIFETSQINNLSHIAIDTNGCINGHNYRIIVSDQLPDVALSQLVYDAQIRTYSVQIQNVGSIPVQNVDFELRMKDSAPLYYNQAVSLPEKEIATLVMPNAYAPDFENGRYICAEVIRVNDTLDGNQSDNQACVFPNTRVFETYPNPFSAAFNVPVYAVEATKAQITIYSLTGEILVARSEIIVNAGFQNVEFDGSYLDAGMYLIEISLNDETSTFRVVKI